MNVMIKNEFASVTCQTKGAELLSYRTVDGKEYMWQKDPAYWAKTSPVLFPYVGPVPKPVSIEGKEYLMPRHGFAKDTEFEVAERREDAVALRMESSDFTRGVFPYEFSFTVTFRLNGAALDVIYGVSNRGDEKMPFLIGGHPGFFCPMEEGEAFTDYVLHFEDEDKPDVHLNYPMFDNDAIFFEEFKERTVKLMRPETGRGLRFDFPDYASVAFWTPIGKEAPFLCIEPWNAGTLGQVGDTDLPKKKYAQFLGAKESREYRYSFRPFDDKK